MSIAPQVLDLLIEKLKGRRNITFLIGAGILHGSGMPTFKGEGAYWTKGISYPRTEDIATLENFMREPATVWGWFLDRLQLVNRSEKNEAHLALEAFHDLFPDRFKLVSQNFCGLHSRLAVDQDLIYLVHGDLTQMRCTNGCSNELYDLPDALANRMKTGKLGPAELAFVRCENCNAICRPNVLMWGEDYTEKFNQINTIRGIAKRSDVLIMAGVIGNSKVSQAMNSLAYTHSCMRVVIDPWSSILTGGAYWIKGKAEAILPALVNGVRSRLDLTGNE